MLTEHPYLIPLVGGFLAGGSAVLIRRASQVFGAWLGWLSLAASLASASSFLAAFLWAATISPAAPSVLQVFLGLLLTLGGSLVAGWSLRVRGIGVLRRWRPDRFEQTQPFRTIRRPLELGTFGGVLGLCLLRPAPTVWICLAVWAVLWSVLLELGDWEFRLRLPACRDYMKRTPRYVPRRK